MGCESLEVKSKEKRNLRWFEGEEGVLGDPAPSDRESRGSVLAGRRDPSRAEGWGLGASRLSGKNWPGAALLNRESSRTPDSRKPVCWKARAHTDPRHPTG